MALTTNLLEACSETFRTAIFEDLCYQSIDSIIGSSPLKPFFTKAVTHVTLHNSMVNFFVDVLLAESEIFIEDLVATDEKLARNDGMLSSSSQNDSCDEDVPVAELIFTAHLCLMLHTCLFGKISSDKTGVVKPSGGYVLNSAKVSQSILSRLPRKSWWLCIRILKGYLALQGQVSYL